MANSKRERTEIVVLDCPATAAGCIVLGIETSCDETAAAVVHRRGPGFGVIKSNIVRSQWDQHRPFGGVVPEIAARAHVECLDQIIGDALRDAGTPLNQIDAIAVTAGPGLIGGLIVGLTTAKALAFAAAKPLIAVNHLEAHALTVGLTEGLAPPYLLLLVSGGHTQILHVADVGVYTRLATTIDDALGEAFDKTAKLLGLGQPGGPHVELAARAGDANRFALPRPMAGRPEPHFSFAGLKTAVRRQAQLLQPLKSGDVADLCASFEAAVTSAVADRCVRAFQWAETNTPPDAPRRLVIAGGVAANQTLRAGLTRAAATHGWQVHVPPVALCGDNGAMIAWAGAERLVRGLTDGLDVGPRPRWPLDAAAVPALGHGRHGAKA
jgi:N6-L-threonylcarbamoyladenine synthase